MAEIAFEYLRMARETTRGTAVTPPTHTLYTGGTLTPTKSIYRPTESRGTLASNYRSAVTRRGTTFELTEEATDTNILPFLLNGVVRGDVTTAATPVGAVNARLWEFTRQTAADLLNSFTLYFGDFNIQTWQSPFAMFTEFVLSSDASSEDGVLRHSGSGIAQPWATVANPAVPTNAAGVLLPSQLMQLWIDPAPGAIGTTAVTGRLISATHTFTTGVTEKYLGGGATATLGFATVGRARSIGVTTTLRLEVPNLTEYNQWLNHTNLAVRVRHNGPIIDSTPDFFHYVEVDTYGPFEDLTWGENAESNRVIELTINGEYNATLASDCRVAVQNALTAL